MVGKVAKEVKELSGDLPVVFESNTIICLAKQRTLQ